MCGRFTLSDTNPTRLRKRFELPGTAELHEQPRFNIAPTDPVLAIRERADGMREPGRVRWGLLPGRWALEPGSRPLINARAESLERRPAFRDAFRERRCLIPADGFYEWRPAEQGKTPVWVSRAGGELFAFAGLWASLEGQDGELVHSCAIVTCEPNDLIRPVHDRMPVILEPEAEATWLSADAGPADLTPLLAPLPSSSVELHNVSDAVNDVREDGPHLLEPPLRLFRS
jgi:putative SOS response-associated peptidase YedK